MKRAAMTAALLLALAGLGAATRPEARRPSPAATANASPTPSASAANRPYALRPVAFAKDFNAYKDCLATRPARCGNTNALLWSDGFKDKVARYLGDRRRTYLAHPDGREGPDATGMTVAEAMLEVLGGPPDDMQRLGPYYLFTACRAHSCSEKGLALLGGDGQIVALGILHYWNLPGEVEQRRCCGSEPDLDIYLRPVDDITRVLPTLRDWGQQQAATTYRAAGASVPKLHAIRLFAVRRPAA